MTKPVQLDALEVATLRIKKAQDIHALMRYINAKNQAGGKPVEMLPDLSIPNLTDRQQQDAAFYKDLTRSLHLEHIPPGPRSEAEARAEVEALFGDVYDTLNEAYTQVGSTLLYDALVSLQLDQDEMYKCTHQYRRLTQTPNDDIRMFFIFKGVKITFEHGEPVQSPEHFTVVGSFTLDFNTRRFVLDAPVFTNELGHKMWAHTAKHTEPPKPAINQVLHAIANIFLFLPRLAMHALEKFKEAITAAASTKKPSIAVVTRTGSDISSEAFSPQSTKSQTPVSQ